MGIDHELLRRSRFDQVIERLLEKRASVPHRGTSAPCIRSLSLDWILANRRRVVDHLLQSLKRRHFTFGPARAATVFIDKPREILSRPWPERLVEHVIAGILHEQIKPLLLPSVYSFQRGRSNRDAVISLAERVRECHERGETLYYAKRDILDYGKSIPAEFAYSRVRAIIGDSGPYFLKLLYQLLNPLVVSEKGEAIQHRGSPTGSPLGPQIDNLFLTPLDELSERIPGLFYIRYCDDILFASLSRSTLADALHQSANTIKTLGLSFHPGKTQDGQLGARPPHPIGTTSLDYLGYNINEHGRVFLSTSKVKELKSFIRRSIRDASHAARRTKTPARELVVADITRAVNTILNGSSAHAFTALIHRSCDDSIKIKALDRWIACQILGAVYGTTHARVFRRFSYKRLRELGLHSLAYDRWAGDRR